MKPKNPYHYPPGPDLDLMVHVNVLGKQTIGKLPGYSTEKIYADQLLQAIKRRFGGKFEVGRTQSSIKPFYARHQSRSKNFHEVLAESMELAVSRLAILLSEHRF